MTTSIIVALAENYCIGKDNQLPWSQSADLQHFKELTLNKPIIMGRKTFESIGKALPKRINVVITQNKHYLAADCDVQHSLKAAIEAYQDYPEVMIIGGANIFEQALPLVDKMYLTWIHTEVNGDAFFPQWNAKEWQEVSREKHSADDKNQFAYSFVVLRRKSLT